MSISNHQKGSKPKKSLNFRVSRDNFMIHPNHDHGGSSGLLVQQPNFSGLGTTGYSNQPNAQQVHSSHNFGSSKQRQSSYQTQKNSGQIMS